MAVDSYCVGCVYRTRISTGLCCSYSDITGHIRGCKAGEGCTRRVLGKMAKSVKEMTYSEREAQASAESRKNQRPTSTPPDYDRAEHERQRVQKRTKSFREKVQGRQRAAIVEYKKAHGLSNRALATELGITETRVAKWVAEYSRADWELLATIGIQRPEGL